MAPQVQWLGIWAGTGGGWNWWCVQTRLQGPTAGAYVVPGARLRHTHRDGGERQLRGSGLTAAVGALGCQHS